MVLLKKSIKKRKIEKIGLLLFIAGTILILYYADKNIEFGYYFGIAAIAIGGLCYYFT